MRAVHKKLAVSVILTLALLGTGVGAVGAEGPVTMTYRPFLVGDWHTHPGTHVIEVVSGTLSIYELNGGWCTRTDYGPGQAFTGGTLPHQAANEGSVSTVVRVTYNYTPTWAATIVEDPGCGAYSTTH